MRVLLDTHALIWWWDGQGRLSDKVIDIMQSPENEVFVSAISALEIAIKVRLGQLPQMQDKIVIYEASVAADGFRPLAVDAGHAARAGLMTGIHRDPFDRVLAAQATIEELVLLSRDRKIAQFGCEVLW